MVKHDLITKPHSVYIFYLFAALALLELLMSFSFLGYFHLPPISITIAYIPILISAICLSIPKTIALGALFGAISAYKASAYYAILGDMVFSPFRSNEPLNSLILSVGTRMIFAFLIAIIFRQAVRYKHRYLLIALAGAVAPSLHAALVFYTMGELFPEVGFNLSSLLNFGVNDLLIAIFSSACSVLCLAIHRSHFMRSFQDAVDKYKGNRRIDFALFCMVIFVFVIMTCVGFYFSRRVEFMLLQYNVFITDALNHDLLQQLLQFTIAALSLSLLLVLLLLAVYRYMAYHGYLGELDALTNVLGRRIFFEKYQQIKYKSSNHLQEIWFLIFDVDYFKQINDSYGHLTGDKVLRHIAQLLTNVFGDHGVIGRMGGDEFAVLINTPISAEDMQYKLNDYFNRLKHYSLPSGNQKSVVSCSAGVCRFPKWLEPQEAFRKADRLLYLVKHEGRAGFAMDVADGSQQKIKTKIFSSPLSTTDPHLN